MTCVIFRLPRKAGVWCVVGKRIAMHDIVYIFAYCVAENTAAYDCFFFAHDSVVFSNRRPLLST